MKYNQTKLENKGFEIGERVAYFDKSSKDCKIKKLGYGEITNFYSINENLYCNLEEEGSALFAVKKLIKINDTTNREEEINSKISFIKGNIKFLKYKTVILSPEHPKYKDTLFFLKIKILEHKKTIIDLKIELLKLKGEKNEK